ncbi:MAG TPA: hypothetical protein VLI55_04495 [Bryobacteraceae bacterium]|nr:hypothetical protein [Bryobacteraceae bacterium]
MTARSIRRAQERKAKKLARKSETNQVERSFQAAMPAVQPVSEAQVAANRANAQLSTGPSSNEGKATSCLNAVKTGLTGRTVLLHTDDAAEYQHYLAAYEKEFSPVGQRECDLVQSIADTCWRLRRIPGLELAIYAQGRARFADEFKDYDAALQPGLIELSTFMAYEKQLRNLQLQEARLSRRREKEIAELRELQQARKAETASRDEACLVPSEACLVPMPNGFEFSLPDIESYLEAKRASSPARARAA